MCYEKIDSCQKVLKCWSVMCYEANKQREVYCIQEKKVKMHSFMEMITGAEVECWQRTVIWFWNCFMIVYMCHFGPSNKLIKQEQ